jgi:FtsH-binding integral membrane protein
MATIDQPRPGRTTFLASDETMRADMIRTYWIMAASLLASALSAALVAEIIAVQRFIFNTPVLRYVVVLSPLLFAATVGARITRCSAPAVYASLIALAALTGVALACIFLLMAGVSVAIPIATTAGLFAALGLLLHLTRPTRRAPPLVLIATTTALIAADLVHLMLDSTKVEFALSTIGILAFAMLTVRDGRRRRILLASGTRTSSPSSEALSLYMSALDPRAGSATTAPIRNARGDADYD